MNDLDIVWGYVHTCASGALRLSECGPVWQFGVIAFFLCVAVITLVVLRVRSAAQPNRQ